MKLQITIEVFKKGDWYIARAPELDFVSQGKTFEEAKNNLFEVIRIQLSEMNNLGTLDNYMIECGFDINKDDMIIKTALFEVEKTVVTL